MRLQDAQNGEDSSSSLSNMEKGEQVDQAPASVERTPTNDPSPKEAPSTTPSGTDWDGPDDPGNPMNWSSAAKAYHVTVPGLYGFAVTFGTSVYTPALFSITEHFHISRTVALLGLTLYTFGLGLGPIIAAPLSERYGRRIVYLISGPVFMLFILGAGFSKTFASFLVCRLLAGVMGSPALAVAGGTTADLVVPSKRAKVTTIFIMAPFAGPSIGPVVGGFAAQYKGWRWSQWCILFVSLVVFLSAIPMKETYKPIILKRRAKERGILPKETSGGGGAVKKTVVQNFLRPMHMLVTEPVVFFLSLYTSFLFGILFLFFAAIPYIFQRPPYLFNTWQTGLIFLSIGLGVCLGAITGIVIDSQIYQKKHREFMAAGLTHTPPEHRLYNGMIGGFGIPVGLFWFAWTADKGVHWAVPAIGAVPFAWGNVCVFISAVIYMVDCYGPMNGASALAANGIFRYTLGSVFPLFTIQMYQRLGTGWATSLLGFLALLMLPIPFILFKFGPAIRKRSHYPVII